LAFIFLIFLPLVGCAIGFAYKVKDIGNRVYPGVVIDGRDVSYQTKEEIKAFFARKEAILAQTQLLIRYKNETVGTFSAELLDLHYNGDEVAEKAYLIARTTHIPSRIVQIVSSFLSLTTFSFPSELQYNRVLVVDFAKQLEQSYNKPPQNALFTFKDERVSEFRREEKGVRIQTDRLLADIDRSLKNLKKRSASLVAVNLSDTPLEPEITLSKANKFGIEDLIAVGVSNYAHSIPERIHNVILAASKFNGVLIPQGKTFSFNQTIGEISSITGYQPAYIIKEGRTVLGDGGGVCQVSTTLFRAALNAGLPIIEQHPHAYRVSYYENGSKPGLDATVFSPSVDLKIRNDTSASILIQTEADAANTTLTFKFYGKKDNRQIDMSPITLYDVQAPPPAVYQDDPSLKRGIVKQVDFPAWGGKTSFDYKVTKDGVISFQKKFVSVYKPWQAIFLVGVQD